MQIGEFISKGPKEYYPYHAEVLSEYVNTFDFSAAHGSSFDNSLRTFLGFFRLPGEAQCIDRYSFCLITDII
jgi:brefeldin A-resistance guanine nucleotide exchange factor 1